MKYLIAIVMTLLLLNSATALDISQNEALKLRENGKIISLEKLLYTIDSRHPHSRLLEIELEKEKDNYFYEVEIITQEGVFREITLNAMTGEIISDEEDD